MKLEGQFEQIIDRALAGGVGGREDSAYLLSLDPESLEAAILMSVADRVARRRNGNSGMLLGQIGIDVSPCPGNCGFCAFGQDHTSFAAKRMTMSEVADHAHALTHEGDVFGLFLMTMHLFDVDYVIEAVETARGSTPPDTQIWVNVGDMDVHTARRLRGAGVSGAYHVCRLREGMDTNLPPEQRLATFAAIKEAGLHLYSCCEPIGPEHTAEELVEQLSVGVEQGLFQHAAMRRVYVPGSRLAYRGQITERRLAQIVAVITLAASPDTFGVSVHEPNLLGLAAGANVITAESGVNPRDAAKETSEHRGMSIGACRRMLYEAGFTSMIRGDGTRVPLTIEYLEQTDSLP